MHCIMLTAFVDQLCC